MTWPFENNTNAIVKRLAKKSIKSDRKKNFLIMITIALATSLIMATALYFFNSQRSSLNDASGRYQAIINDANDETINKITNDNRVKSGVSYLFGMISYGDYKLTVRTMDESLMEMSKYPPLQGNLPTKDDEVAITQAFLNRAGLSAKINETIKLDLGNGEKEYKISGILPVTNSNYSVYVAETFINNSDNPPLCSVYFNIKNSEGWNKAGVEYQLYNLGNEWGLKQEQIQLSTYYFSLIEQRSMQYMMIIIIISLIVAIVCALVVYSLFYISIIRKTNEYGKLRTIGATKKQVKKIVYREGRYLSSISIPLGIIIGSLVGYLLAPSGWYLLTAITIMIITAIFMFSCTMITIIKPANIASKSTPIESICYIGTSENIKIKSTNKLTRKMSIGKFAFLNFKRNKKKTILTIASLGCCGILLMASSAFFNSIDPVNMARKNFPEGEIRIELGTYGPQSHNAEEYLELQKNNLLTPDIVQSILNINGVKSVDEFKGSVLNYELPSGYTEKFVTDTFSEDKKTLFEEYLIEGTIDQNELLENNGILIQNSSQWKDVLGWDVKLGDLITVINTEGERTNVKIMGIIDHNIPFGGYNTLFMPEQMLNSIVPLKNLNYQLIVDTDGADWRDIKEQIQNIFSSTDTVYISTLNDWVESFREKIINYQLPVYIFVIFIGVFGVINLLNTLITNMLARRREFGILHAVAFTSKQLSLMLLIEGLLYTLGIFISSITIGSIIGYLLCRVFSNMSVFGLVKYKFPIIEMTGFFVLMLFIQLLFSLITTKQLRKQSLVEQIQD